MTQSHSGLQAEFVEDSLNAAFNVVVKRVWASFMESKMKMVNAFNNERVLVSNQHSTLTLLNIHNNFQFIYS